MMSMLTKPLPYVTLADSEWIGLVIVLVVAAASWIGNILKQQNQQKQSQQGQSPTAPSRRSGPSRSDQLAARRRAQLEQLARRRHSRAQPSSSLEEVEPGAPGNLTMGQLQQRARAKAEYAKRTSALRTRQQAARPASTPPQRAAVLRKTLGHSISQRRLQPIEALIQPAVRPVPISSRLGQGVTAVDKRLAGHGGYGVHRHVSDTGIASRRSRSRSRLSRLLGGRSLQDAIVLKEILDQPLALREQPGPFA